MVSQDSAMNWLCVFMACFLILTNGTNTFYESITPCNVPQEYFKRSYDYVRHGTLLMCVFQCGSDQRCKSLIFNKTMLDCWLFPQFDDLEINPISDLELINLRQKAVPGLSTDQERFNMFGIFIIEVNTKFKDAERKCSEKGGGLFQIDNQEKQDAAVALAKSSGLEYLSIGAYTNLGVWMYADGTHVNFTAWHNNRTPFFGTYAALAKKYNYEWVNRRSVNGAICEKNIA